MLFVVNDCNKQSEINNFLETKQHICYISVNYLLIARINHKKVAIIEEPENYNYINGYNFVEIKKIYILYIYQLIIC